MALNFVSLLSAPDYFLWTDAAYGEPTEVTAIESPLVTYHENICFTFWFDIRVS